MSEIGDDQQSAVVKADAAGRQFEQALREFLDSIKDFTSLRKAYTEAFFLVLFFALAAGWGAGLIASALIAIALSITPWLRHAARIPATLLMLPMLINWAGILPIAKWAHAFIHAINQAVG